MKNKRRLPAESSSQNESLASTQVGFLTLPQIELLASSAVKPHGDTAPVTHSTESALGHDSLRRVTADEVESLHRTSRGRGRSSRSGSGLRSRTGAIPGRPSPENSHHHRGLKIAIIVTLVLILGIAITAYVVWQNLMGQVTIVDPALETVPSEYNVPTESLVYEIPVAVEKGIQNILLMGVDSREEDTLQTNSDSMMILTVDTINNTIKLTSLQRDMLVYEPGKKDPVKLNAVNTHGGPALTMRVINETLRLNITNYVMVNMGGMESIIDIAGGVLIDVEKDELPYINGEISYQNSIFPNTPKSGTLSKAGLQTLNGRQAVAYARIRHGDSDYARMGRQRIIIQALLDRFMAANVSTKTNMISKGLSYITTNISKTELTKLGLTTVPMMKKTIEQMQLPITGYFIEDPDPVWVNRCDFNGMIPLLQKFIYGQTFPFDPVKKIAGAPNSGISMPTTKATTTKPATTKLKPTTTSTTTSTESSSTTTEKTTPIKTTATATTEETTSPATTTTEKSTNKPAADTTTTTAAPAA